MTKLFNIASAAALACALIAQPAFAQAKRPAAPAQAAPAPAAPRGTVVQGVGVLDIQAAVGSTIAYQSATKERQTRYKPTLDAAQARWDQYEGQLKPMRAQLNADIQAKKPEAQLQAQYTAIKRLEAQRDNEIEQMLMPVKLSDEYVIEQITDKLPQAVNNVLSRRGITLLLTPDAVLYNDEAYDVTGLVVAELNVLVPAVQVVPPQGWLPRRVREQQQAQQQAQQPAAPAQPGAKPVAAPAPRPAGPQPEGR